MQKFRSQDGYLTIEASIVFLVVMFSTFVIVFLGILLYQQVKFQNLAFETVSRGAIIYNRLNDKNMETGVVTLASFKDRDPYRFIWDTKTNSKKQIINAYLIKNGNENNIEEAIDDPSNGVDIKNYVITKKAYVNIQANSDSVLSVFFTFFGFESPVSIDARASSNISESVELIRNTDLCIDVLKSFDSVNKGMEKLSEIKEKIISYSDYLKLD